MVTGSTLGFCQEDAGLSPCHRNLGLVLISLCNCFNQYSQVLVCPKNSLQHELNVQKVIELVQNIIKQCPEICKVYTCRGNVACIKVAWFVHTKEINTCVIVTRCIVLDWRLDL